MLSGDNIPVAAVLTSQVSHLVLHHCSDRVEPPTFSVQPKKYTFKAKLLKPRALQTKPNDRETVEMKGYQIPVLINNATTGHKLQGSGVDKLFVHNWSYVTNWAYVMLSRVKTIQGLFLRKPLSEDLSKYAMPEKLQQMMDKFKEQSPSYWQEDEYEDLLLEE